MLFNASTPAVEVKTVPDILKGPLLIILTVFVLLPIKVPPEKSAPNAIVNWLVPCDMVQVVAPEVIFSLPTIVDESRLQLPDPEPPSNTAVSVPEGIAAPPVPPLVMDQCAVADQFPVPPIQYLFGAAPKFHAVFPPAS